MGHIWTEQEETANMEEQLHLDAVSIVRLRLVNPALSVLIVQMADSLGTAFRVVQGLRTWAEQDTLYAQGRTAPGEIVTNARGGQSWHNLGCAVDLVPMDPTPDWNLAHPAWQAMLTCGVALGLTEGAKWCHPDNPHFQLTGRFPANAPDDEARQIYQNSGAQALYDAVNALAPPATITTEVNP